VTSASVWRTLARQAQCCQGTSQDWQTSHPRTPSERRRKEEEVRRKEKRKKRRTKKEGRKEGREQRKERKKEGSGRKNEFFLGRSPFLPILTSYFPFCECPTLWEEIGCCCTRWSCHEVSSRLRGHTGINVNWVDNFDTLLHGASRNGQVELSNCFWHTRILMLI